MQVDNVEILFCDANAGANLRFFCDIMHCCNYPNAPRDDFIAYFLRYSYLCPIIEKNICA